MDKERLSVVSAIALNSIFGSNPKLSHCIIDTLGSTEAVFGLSGQELDETFGPYRNLRDKICPASLESAEREYDRLSAMGYRFVSIMDEDYPAMLRECPDAPVLLYVRSFSPVREIFRKDTTFVSIVGTRDMSLYGKEFCRRMVKALAEAPSRPVIVSGLALGIDISAHLAALEYGLHTIGVSPVGIEDVYPARHASAAGRIAGTPGSGIVTDYPPGTVPLPFTFLRRNRIIAGLSGACILVESRIRGGGMMTARLAAGYGREVFALPGRADDARSRGCNLLIRGRIAEIIDSPEALPEALGLGKCARGTRTGMEESVRRHFPGLSGPDAEALCGMAGHIRDNRGISLDELCSARGMSYSDVSRLAGMLESEGLIEIDLLQRCSAKIMK